MLTKPIGQWEGDKDEFEGKINEIEERLDLIVPAIEKYGASATGIDIDDDALATNLEQAGWDIDIPLGEQKETDEYELAHWESRLDGVCLALDNADRWNF